MEVRRVQGRIAGFAGFWGGMPMLQWKPRLFVLLAVIALLAIAAAGGEYSWFSFLEW
jgi:hypothetical protein